MAEAVTSQAALTEEQTQALRDMQEHFEGAEGYGLHLDEMCFRRYLRSENWDLKKSIAKLQNTLDWRQSFEVHKIDEWADVIAEENATGKTYVRGFDKQGRAILYMKPRHENSTSHDGNLKHLVYNMERAMLSMRERGVQEKICLIVDYEGFSLRNSPPMKTSKAVLSILQNHYPERLGIALLLNPPWIFQAFWTVIYPLIDPVTKQKIRLVSSNISETLLEHIDADVLEAGFGGNDDRKFDSSIYLSHPLTTEFTQALEKQETLESS